MEPGNDAVFTRAGHRLFWYVGGRLIFTIDPHELEYIRRGHSCVKVERFAILQRRDGHVGISGAAERTIGHHRLNFKRMPIAAVQPIFDDIKAEPGFDFSPNFKLRLAYSHNTIKSELVARQ